SIDHRAVRRPCALPHGFVNGNEARERYEHPSERALAPDKRERSDQDLHRRRGVPGAFFPVPRAGRPWREAPWPVGGFRSPLPALSTSLIGLPVSPNLSRILFSR